MGIFCIQKALVQYPVSSSKGSQVKGDAKENRLRLWDATATVYIANIDVIGPLV